MLRTVLVGVAVVTTGVLAAVGPAAHAVAPDGGPGPRPVVVTDVASASGVFEVNRSWSACESPDAALLYVGDHQLSSHVYAATRSGVYSELPKGRAWPRSTDGLRADRHGCAIADFDGNGRWDVANSTGRSLANFVKPDNRDNELWLQQPDGTFVDVGTETGIGDPCTRGRQMATADWSGPDGESGPDGLPDLVIGAMAPRLVVDACSVDPSSQAAHLFANQGHDADGRWLGMARVQDLGTDEVAVRCAEAHDLDGDGLTDLVACQRPGSPAVAYRNVAGRLVARPAAASGLTEPVADLEATDVTGDGVLDALQARKDSCGYQRGDGRGHFGPYVTITTLTDGAGRSVAAGRTGAGMTVYCQTTRSGANPDDVVAVRTVDTDGVASWEGHPVVTNGGQADEVTAVHPWGRMAGSSSWCSTAPATSRSARCS